MTDKPQTTTLEQSTCPCKWCGSPTKMMGTQMCDRCWELERRIYSNPELARKMLSCLQAKGLKVPARTMADFGQLHFNWMRAVEQRGLSPYSVTTMPAIEMTQEEHDNLRGEITLHDDKQSGITKLFGHPVRISEEPEDTIPLPSRV